MKLFRALIALIALGLSQAVSAQSVQTEIIKYNGNVITKVVERDTSMSVDPETYEVAKIISHRKGIKLLNNQLVYADQEVEPPVVANAKAQIEDHLRNLLSPELSLLKQEVLEKFSAQIIIDDKGKFAYFEPSAQVYENKCRNEVCEILDCMEKKLEGIRCIPALAEGESVPYWIDFTALKQDLVIN
jgi:hypothetical protein